MNRKIVFLLQVSMFVSSSIKTCMEHKEDTAKCYNFNRSLFTSFEQSLSGFWKIWNQSNNRQDSLYYPKFCFTCVQCKYIQNLVFQ
jgi:hypothetical protein